MSKYVRDSKPGDTILLAYKVPLDASYDQNDGSYLYTTNCSVNSIGQKRVFKKDELICVD